MDRVEKAAEYLLHACGEADIGLILGSGLGDAFSGMEDQQVIPYEKIPGFPQTTVSGHHGEWHYGTQGGKRLAVMRGRFHFYEGHPIEDVVFPVRVMQRLGIRILIITNAAGGVNLSFQPGDLMLIEDTINYSGVNPLIGKNDERIGPRFPDMSEQFDPALLAIARKCASDQRISLQKGVYMWFSGPSFETPAEIRMARILGADAVGMSTVPEVLVARHCGMRVLGISCITNMAAGILKQPLNHAEVLETGKRVQSAFVALIHGIIKEIVL